VRNIKAKTKISVVIGIALLISFITIFLSPKFVKSQESYTPITNCTQITQPGEYRLTQDIIDSSASICIDIQSNDVILDCQGHIVDGTRNLWTLGISISGSNVTIKNCIVRDWFDGIHVSSNNTLLNITAYSNMDNGILVGGAYNTLINVTSDSNGDGIYIQSGYNTLLNITATNNRNYGVFIYQGDNILSNIIANFNSYGIGVNGVNNEIVNSIIQDNSQYGIYIVTGSSSIIYNNIFNNTNNLRFGQIYQNYWNTTLQPGTNIWNSSLGYIGGNLWTNPNNNGYSDTCVDANYDGFCDQPYDLLGDGSNIDYLPIAKYVGQSPPPTSYCGNGVCEPGEDYTTCPADCPPPYTPITGCAQITQPGEYRLTQDIIDQNVSTCIEIQSNDVILDCQGHLIDGVDFYVPGPPEQMSFGIHSHGYNNITIKNCKLSDWSHPFNFEYTTNVTALNIEAFSGPWIGPFFESGNNIYIENLTAYDFGADGLTLRNTTNSYVKNVEIYNCSKTGLGIDTGSNNDVIENATVYNMGITGIHVSEDCNSITLRNIVAYNNVYSGLDIKGSNHILENIETYNTSPENPGLRINSINTTLRNIFNHDEYRSIIDWGANNVTLEYSRCSNVTYGCWHIFGNNTIIRNNDFPSGIGFFGAYSSEVYNNTLGGLETKDWNGVTPTLINIYNNTFSFKNVQYIRNVFLFDSKIHDNVFYVINDNFGKTAYVGLFLNVTNFEFFNNIMYAYNVSGNSPSWFIPLIRYNATNASFYNNYGYGKYPNAEFIAVSMRATDAEKIYIYNNYVESTDDQCFQLTNGREQYFYNNTILDGCVWVIGPVSDVYIYDNKISEFAISSGNNPINNMYAYNNTIWGNATNSPGVKIWYADVDFGTKLVGSNIFHLETDTLTPYLSVILNYSSIDYGTTQPFRSYDYIGGITVNTNMLDYKIEVDSTDLVSGTNSISKNNLSFGFNKTLDFNYLLNPYNTITILKQNLQDTFNILTRLYVPLVAPGTYTGTITITVSQGLSDNQIPNPHGGVNAQMV